MTRQQVEDEMVEGYRDGLKRDSPDPSGNRSLSYMHGFANGRADLAHTRRGFAGDLRERAEQCIAADVNAYVY